MRNVSGTKLGTGSSTCFRGYFVFFGMLSLLVVQALESFDLDFISIMTMALEVLQRDDDLNDIVPVSVGGESSSYKYPNYK